MEVREAIVNWRLIGRAVVVGVVVFVASMLIEFDPLEIDEWTTWAIDIGGGLARSVGAAILAVVWVARDGTANPEKGV